MRCCSWLTTLNCTPNNTKDNCELWTHKHSQQYAFFATPSSFGAASSSISIGNYRGRKCKSRICLQNAERGFGLSEVHIGTPPEP